MYIWHELWFTLVVSEGFGSSLIILFRILNFQALNTFYGSRFHIMINLLFHFIFLICKINLIMMFDGIASYTFHIFLFFKSRQKIIINMYINFIFYFDVFIWWWLVWSVVFRIYLTIRRVITLFRYLFHSIFFIISIVLFFSRLFCELSQVPYRLRFLNNFVIYLWKMIIFMIYYQIF